MGEVILARPVSAPRERGAPFLAFLIAASFLMIALSRETQTIARRAGYSAQLGAPLYSHFYAPWASLDWMLKYDWRLNLFASASSPYPSTIGTETAWAREAFAAERRRLSWEAAGAFVLFLALSIMLPDARKNSDLHGQARWATGRDLRRSALTRAQYGVTLGQTKRLFGLPGTLLIHNDTQNVLGIGPPGEGKSNGIARPSLTKTWLFWSAIVFDPAYELTPLTARARARHTRVQIFDPRSRETARFNPLDGIATGDVDGVRAVLSSFFYDRDASELSADSRIFESRALAFAVAVTSHVIELGAPTLEAAARYVSDPAWKSEAEICESLLKSEIRYVQETGAEFARMTEKQRSPFIATLTDRFELFRSPDVANATSASDISSADLRREATTLYLVVREKDQAALNPLMRMMMTRLIHDLVSRLPEKGEQRILLMIDEFPLLKAPIIEQELATMRKYWIHAVLLAQTLSQVRKYYGSNESISGLCDVRVFFPSVDDATQRLASNTCGQSTRWAESVSHDDSGKKSYSTHEAGRPLLYPHELADMKAWGEIIVYKKGEHPIKARPVQAHRDRRFTETKE